MQTIQFHRQHEHRARWHAGILPLTRAVLLSALLGSLLGGCATAPPDKPNNICKIFHQYHGWYADAAAAQKRWGTPIAVQLAIIYQESGYHSKIRPPRTHILWIIPWKRPSSAYGYTQALDSTWTAYEQASGNGWADRDDFGDSTDFVAWYVDENHRLLGLSRADAYSNYLAYYLGRGGFRRGVYRHKPNLRHTAWRVSARAKRYTTQLNGCRRALESQGHWWWPF